MLPVPLPPKDFLARPKNPCGGGGHVEKAYIGVDGGGSSTEACVMTQDGRVLGKGTGGPSNFHYCSRDVFTESVRQAVAGALNEAHRSAGDVGMACLALAGAGRASDAAKARDMLSPVLDPLPFYIVEDTKAALAAAHGAGDGIIVIAGTGSNCLGVKDDRYASAGGWGSLFGDEGSAYMVAVEGLRAAAKSSDGRLGPSRILPDLLSALGAAAPGDLVSLIHDPDRSRIARLSRAVFGAADAGDAEAMRILEAQAQELAIAASAVASKLALIAPGIGLVGGCFLNPLYVALFERRVRSLLPDAQVFQVSRAPSEGAAILARERCS